MSIVAEKIKLLDMITDLKSQHPPMKNHHSCPDPECKLCPQIRELGKQYEFLTLQKRQKRREAYSRDVIEKRAKAIIAKGRDATKSEIEFLIDVAKMPKREIAPRLGINLNVFLNTCKAWGLGRINERRAT